MKRALLVVLAASLVFAGGAAAAQANSRPRVLAITFGPDLEINPVTQGYVTSELSKAADDGYDAAVILLDTPGGLSSSMKTIYQAELASKVPVIVYVSPEGSRAASAGVWVSQAADVLAMSPDSNIGSSTPIDSSGQNLGSDLRHKVINDAVGLADGARGGPSPQHEVAGEGRARRLQPHRAAGAEDERDRRDRADAACSPQAARRLPHEVRATALHAAPGQRGDRHGQARLHHALPQHDHRPEPDQPPLPARDRRAHLRGAPSWRRPARSPWSRRPRDGAVRVLGAQTELGRAGAHPARRRPAGHRPALADARRAHDRRRHIAPLRAGAPVPERARRVSRQPVADRRHRRGDIHLLGLCDGEGACGATPARDDRRADDGRAEGRGSRAGARLRRRRALAGACRRRVGARPRRGGRGRRPSTGSS